MSDTLLLGSGVSLFEPDARANYRNSQETTIRPQLRTRTYYPFGKGRDGLIRRIMVEIEHEEAIHLVLTPYLDGEALETVSLVRAAQRELHTFVVPVARQSASGHAGGARGSAVELEIYETAPLGQWTLRGLSIAVRSSEVPTRHDAALNSL